MTESSKETQIMKLLEIGSLAGDLMLKNGAEIYRVEDTVERIIRSRFSTKDVDVFATFNAMIYAFNVDGKIYSNVRRVKNRDNNLVVVDEVNSFSRRFCQGELTIDQGLEEIEKIKEKHTTNKKTIQWIKIIGAGFASCSFNVIVNNKFSLVEFLVCFIVGFVSFFAFTKIKKKMYGYFLDNFFAGIVVAGLTIIINHFIKSFNYENVIIASMMPYVPGFIITNAIRDLMSGDSTTGLTGLSMAFLISAALALGVAIPIALM